MVKIGKTKDGYQRLRCGFCGKSFQLGYTYNACKPGIKEKIIEMANDKNSLNQTKKALNVGRRTVIRERKKKGFEASLIQKSTPQNTDEKIARKTLSELYRDKNLLAKRLTSFAPVSNYPDKVFCAPVCKNPKNIEKIIEKLDILKILISEKEVFISKNWPIPKKPPKKTVIVSGSIETVFHGSNEEVLKFLRSLKKTHRGLKIVIS